MQDEATRQNRTRSNVSADLPKQELLSIGNDLPSGGKAAVAVGAMLVLALVVNFFNIPNPNMILVAGLVVFSTLFGWQGGIPAASVMVAYTLYFFSTDNSWVHFTFENAQKVSVVLIGVAIITLFVCTLRRMQDAKDAEVRELMHALQEDNRLLAEASEVDSLTGLRNRLALRNDYDLYANDDLYVIMIDIDGFKDFNDKYGHDVGDHVLAHVGQTLSALYGKAHAYRYGGDEFLLVVPGLTEEDLTSKDALMRERAAAITVDGVAYPANLSAGYVYGHNVLRGDLRNMFKQADQQLYRSKEAGKGRTMGAAFVREGANN